MSCFQVTTTHLNKMLASLRWSRGGQSFDLVMYSHNRSLGAWCEDETWARAAAILWDANRASVTARYPHETGMDGGAYDPTTYWSGPNAPVNPVEVLKLCDCFDYQACEADGYEESIAAALVQRIRQDAICRLPGYDAAPWALETDGPYRRPAALREVRS